MIFSGKTIRLRDGRAITLRTADDADAGTLCRYINTVSTETEFLLRSANDPVTEDEERKFIRRIRDSKFDQMITAFDGARAVGNAQIAFHGREKTRHRAGIGIAVLAEYWGLGLGTALMEELIAAARERNVHQVELQFVEGNDRARRLYEKMGFSITGELPDAIRLADGSFRREIAMRLVLSGQEQQE